MASPLRALLALLVCALLPARANTPASLEISPKPGDNFSRAEFQLFIPPGVEPASVKRILCFAAGFNGNSAKWLQAPEFVQLAQERQWALWAANFQSRDGFKFEDVLVGKADPRTHYARPDGGSGAAFFQALETLCRQAGIPGHPLLLLHGHSAGGMWNYNLAALHPDRIAAFVVNKGGGVYVRNPDPAIYRIPGLFLCGADDLPRRNKDIRDRHADGARHHAPWKLVEEKGVKHGAGASDSLALEFFRNLTAAPTAGPSPTAPDLHARAKAECPNFLKTWETLVNIDTGTGFAAGPSRAEDFLADSLRKMGLDVQTLPVSTGVGRNVVGALRGNGPGKILLMIHYDTVFPEGEAARRPFRIENARAHGPGVADAKGGAALILHAIRILQASGWNDFDTITVLFNPDEETGSEGSRALIGELARNHDVVLSFEPPESQQVAVATNGINAVILEVHGKASHAGSAPEQGVNAVLELAHQLTRLENLGNPEKMTTVNWTIIRGGERRNIIPDQARAEADMRFSDWSETARVRRQAEEIIRNKHFEASTLDLQVVERRPPLSPNPASDDLNLSTSPCDQDRREPINRM